MKVQRFVIVHAESWRIVATCAGTHERLERICNRLDQARPGTYVYDDYAARREYGPQLGRDLSLTRR